MTLKDFKNRAEKTRYLNQAYDLAGKTLVNATREKYDKWREKKTEANRIKYMKLRLNLHLKMWTHPDHLELLEDELNLGLYNSEAGDLYWGIKP